MLAYQCDNLEGKCPEAADDQLDILFFSRELHHRHEKGREGR